MQKNAHIPSSAGKYEITKIAKVSHATSGESI